MEIGFVLDQGLQLTWGKSCLMGKCSGVEDWWFLFNITEMGRMSLEMGSECDRGDEPGEYLPWLSDEYEKEINYICEGQRGKIVEWLGWKTQPGQRKEGFLRGKALSLTYFCVCVRVGRWWFVVTVRMVAYRVFTVEGGWCEIWDCEMDLCLCAVHFLYYFGWWLYICTNLRTRLRCGEWSSREV